MMPGAGRSLQAVAAFEALKGLVVLCAGSGLLLLVHQDLHALAARFIAHLHLNPASREPAIVLDAARNWHDGQLRALALGAFLYAALRFTEAWGLFRGKAWAEVLAAASGAVYLPFEGASLVRHASGVAAGAFAVNLAVVLLMLRALARRRSRRPPP